MSVTRECRGPLFESAPLARTRADELCRRETDGSSCVGYHGLRQYWRILDLVTTPAHHDFYAQRLRTLGVERGFRDVLISACADHVQLAQVLSASRSVGLEPRITVVDRCPTPLALCEWYAEREAASITTRCTDILQYRPKRRFDLICTHSFLSWFPPSRRREVAGSWHRLLRPGGMVLTVTRIWPETTSPETPVSSNAREVEDFCAQVLDRATRLRDRLDVPPETLVSWARRYREEKTSYGVRSVPALEADFRRSGFEVEAEMLGPLPRPEWRRERGKDGRVNYVGLAATRPAAGCSGQASSD